MDLRFLAVIFLVIAIMEAIGKLLKRARLAEAEEEQEQEPPRPRDPLAEVFRDLRLGQLGDDVVKPAGQIVREALSKAVPAEDAADSAPTAAEKLDAPDDVPPDPPPREPPPRDREPPPREPRRQRERDPATVPSPQGSRPTAPPTSQPPAPAPAAAARHRTPRHEPIPALAALRHRGPGSQGTATAATPRSPRARRWDGAVAAYTSPTTLRHLVVAREVLGPPVALRTDQDPVER